MEAMTRHTPHGGVGGGLLLRSAPSSDAMDFSSFEAGANALKSSSSLMLLSSPSLVSVSSTQEAINEIQPITGSAPLSQGGGNGSGVEGQQRLKKLTLQLVGFYERVNTGFHYSKELNPRRILTKPSTPAHNENHDNSEHDYILVVNEIIGSEDGHQYQILDLLGHGTFGQVAKCQHLSSGQIVAVKVIKNKPAYFNQSMMEVKVLELLNRKYDSDDAHHILRMTDTLIYRHHLCLVFELLSINLYELIKQNNFRGLSTNLVKIFTAQILDCLTVLTQAKLIHCDLKPENILLKSLGSPTLKVIDFGSACQEQRTVYSYIQSRFYRSPEVLLGMAYTAAIDMWSLGCICAELFLGLPLFPGSSEFNQLTRIVEMLGNPPNNIIELGKNGRKYFVKRKAADGSDTYVLKTLAEFNLEYSTDEKPSKRYFESTSLPELVRSYPMRKPDMTNTERSKEMRQREAFLDFLLGLLRLNPAERWLPAQALQHPFITGEPYNGPFEPMAPVDVRSRAFSSPLAPGTFALPSRKHAGQMDTDHVDVKDNHAKDSMQPIKEEPAVAKDDHSRDGAQLVDKTPPLTIAPLSLQAAAPAAASTATATATATSHASSSTSGNRTSGLFASTIGNLLGLQSHATGVATVSSSSNSQHHDQSPMLANATQLPPQPHQQHPAQISLSQQQQQQQQQAASGTLFSWFHPPKMY